MILDIHNYCRQLGVCQRNAEWVFEGYLIGRDSRLWKSLFDDLSLLLHGVVLI